MFLEYEWMNRILMIIVALCSGVGVAAGTFAFFLVIKVLPRIIQKSGLQDKVMSVENTVVKGTFIGTILSLCFWKDYWMFEVFGRILLTVYGLCAGIFAGCISIALAEILDVFPIFLRRIHLQTKYCEALLFVMAIGKLVGSLFYFCLGYGIQNSM